MREEGKRDIRLRSYVRTYYELGEDEEPTKSQVNHVEKLARDGVLAGAYQVGRLWFVDMEEVRNGSKKSGAR